MNNNWITSKQREFPPRWFNPMIGEDKNLQVISLVSKTYKSKDYVKITIKSRQFPNKPPTGFFSKKTRNLPSTELLKNLLHNNVKQVAFIIKNYSEDYQNAFFKIFTKKDGVRNTNLLLTTYSNPHDGYVAFSKLGPHATLRMNNLKWFWAGGFSFSSTIFVSLVKVISQYSRIEAFELLNCSYPTAKLAHILLLSKNKHLNSLMLVRDGLSTKIFFLLGQLVKRTQRETGSRPMLFSTRKDIKGYDYIGLRNYLGQLSLSNCCIMDYMLCETNTMRQRIKVEEVTSPIRFISNEGIKRLRKSRMVT